MAPLLVFHLVAAAAVLGSGAASADDGGTYDAGLCPRSVTCDDDGVVIDYPFHLSNATASIDGHSGGHCGYPGMGIACEEDGRAVLQLGGGNYTVLAINYDNHTVTLADADVLAGGDCPRIHHNVTLPAGAGLAFPSPGNDSIAFFFDCNFPGGAAPPPSYLNRMTNCGGFREEGSLSSFLIAQPDTPPGEWYRACREVLVAPVLQYWFLAYLPQLEIDGYGSYGQVLKQGFHLSWNHSAGGASPACRGCEQSRGQCSYDQAGVFLGCLCSDGRVRSPGGANGPRKPLSKKKAMAIGASIAAVVFFAALVVVSFLYIRKRRQYRATSSSRLLKHLASDETPRSGGSAEVERSGSARSLQTHHFAYEELEAATDGFSDARELGDGGFGTVYKGHLKDGRVVAVKRLYSNSARRVEQFLNEADILSRLRHPNLVTLYGCTSSRSRELLLVYEFVPNGTVADHLHGRRAPERALPWPLRLGIAVEAAAALAYLHAVDPPIVHRDIKTNNILLDASFHVKVADFGLSRLFPVDATHVSTAPQGTPGYVDPEYHQCYQLTDRSDVYSFGVVLVELISSKPAVDVTRERGEINLAGMAVRKIQRGEVEQLVDAGLGFAGDEATRTTMTMVAEMAFRCLQHNGEVRPPIREVLDALRGAQAIMQGQGGKEGAALLAAPCRSPDTVHAPWDSISTTPSISQ